MKIPPVQYLPTSHGHLAWQSWGEGPLTILDTGIGSVFSLEEIDEQPLWLRWMERLSSFARVLRIDYPGLGLSDAVHGRAPNPIGGAPDLLQVLDAAGVDRAVVLGACAHTLTALNFAATHPDRTAALVLMSPSACLRESPGYPQGLPPELIDQIMASFTPGAEASDAGDLAVQAPSLRNDPEFVRWWSRAARRGASPAASAAVNQTLFHSDLRQLLTQITAPTLVMARRDIPLGLLLEQSRFVAARITDATWVELPGRDMLPFAGDAEAVLDEIQLFVTGSRYGEVVEREFAVMLFTDIVGSTSAAVRMGDARWRTLLLDHEVMLRREVRRHGGRQVKDTGDGALCIFPAPSQAIRCALAMRDAAPHLGLQIRAGLHAGEVEKRGLDLAGINVHTAARVSALASPGEVLVSGTLVDLVAGSTLRFTDRGHHELKGVPGRRQVWAVTEA